MKLSEYTNVHCIGIGGIGLSAIARYCHFKGAKVTGSDMGESRITHDLHTEGMTIYKGHDTTHLDEGVTLVIYSIAVKEENPELMEARKRGLVCMSYPEALGLLTEEYITIAVCGTHGKTTTTAMVASMFKACGINPTVIVGSLLTDGGSNFVAGDSEYLIVEACEYRRSFLKLHPTHVIVTNIDEDHLDYYKDLADIKSAFQSFIDLVPNEGSVITHHGVTLATWAKKIDADTTLKHTIKLTVLGDHNKSNAQLALALAQTLGLSEDDARQGLINFTGTWRRLEYKGIWKDVALYDDYAHHPVEIQATLQALRERYPYGEYTVIAVFQPHLYSRTKQHLEEFAESFVNADKICILPIYASREVDDGTISSHDLVEKTLHAVYVESYEEIQKYVLGRPHRKCVLITIGAGDVNGFHESLTDVKK